MNELKADMGGKKQLDADELRARRKRRLTLTAVLAVCMAPIVASYLMYYVIKPEGRTNYGELLQPQKPISGLKLSSLDGPEFSLSSLKGRWVMLTVDSGACEQACQQKLYSIRQVRLTAGKERERVERLFLTSDGVKPASSLLQAHEGMNVGRIEPALAQTTFPVPAGGHVADHIYVVDPLGNLMMRFPKNADPNRMKKDLSKLLRASRVG